MSQDPFSLPHNEFIHNFVSITAADVCREPLDPGPCRASIPKFWYNAATGACTVFAYGGCQGGANRFTTIEECEELCAQAGPGKLLNNPLGLASMLSKN